MGRCCLPTLIQQWIHKVLILDGSYSSSIITDTLDSRTADDNSDNEAAKRRCLLEANID